MNKFVILALVATLAGCAQKWEKPGGTDVEFQSTLSTCRGRAFSMFPPNNYTIQTSAGYTTPAYTSCSGYGYSANCITTGGQYNPPTYMTLDRNDSARDQAVESCLMSNGWRKAERR